MTFKELNKKYNKLLSKETPQAPEKRKTFLEIGNLPHFENVISNYYSFYLDKDEEHRFDELFIKSITELIFKKTDKRITFDFYTVYTEYSTKNNGRIDILIEENDKSKALIIENKIYHSLQNNLTDYWDSIEISNENKIGVLLTLDSQKTENENFVNITHRQLLTQVKKNIGQFMTKSDDRHLLFFKDFSENILKLSQNKTDMKDLYKFYFENKVKIDEIYDIREKARKYFLESIKETSFLLGLNIENSNPKDYKCIIISKNPNLRYWIQHYPNSVEEYIIIYLDIFDESKIDAEKLTENENLIKIAESKGINVQLFDEVKSGISVASKCYSLDSDKFVNLSKSLAEIIKLDWSEFINNVSEEIKNHQQG